MRLTIARRLHLAFLAVVSLMLALGIIALRGMHRLNEATEFVAADRYHKVEVAQQGVALVNANARRSLQLFLAQDGSEFSDLVDDQKRTTDRITALYEGFERELDSDEERRLFVAIREARERYVVRRATAEELLEKGKVAEARVIFEREVLADLASYIAAWDMLLAEEGRRMHEAARDATRTYRRTQILTLGLVALAAAIGVVVGLLATRRVAKPILEIAVAAQRMEAGDHAVRVDVASTDEIGALARAFNTMGAAVAFRHERLQREMNLAQQIQTALLPHNLHVPGFQIAAAMKPATEVGGDYYDVLPVTEGCWIGIGDVAGHGLNAGLVMLMLQSSVATLVSERPESSPEALIVAVNRVLYANLRERLQIDDYATMVLLRCHSDGAVTFAGAHEDILVWREGSGRGESVDTVGTWVGGAPDIEAFTRDSSLTLDTGDVLVLFTDGLTEARDASGVMFGSERLLSALARVHAESVTRIRDELLAAVAAWAACVDDDQTIVVVRYAGSQGEEPPGRLAQVGGGST